jgi:hypothetical protein
MALVFTALIFVAIFYIGHRISGWAVKPWYPPHLMRALGVALVAGVLLTVGVGRL